MSAIGAAVGRGVASLGGPQVAAVVVVAGLVAGALGGAVIGSGGLSGRPATTSGELAVYPCPDQGPALLTVKGGQKLLATGRTEDGEWLRIHFPLPGRTEAWVQASPLSVSGAVDSLPVAECAPEFAAGPPDVLPGATLTAILNLSPSPAPTPEPTPTPSPSPSPSPTDAPNARPSLSALTVSTRKISYDQGAYCPTAVKKVTFKVKASDASGLDSVTLFWRKPGAATYAQSAMSRTTGTATSGTWQVTLDTTADGITKAGKLAFYIVATDTLGATRRLPSSGANAITVAVCVNTGPAITSASSSSGSSLYWDPRGVGCSPTITTITASVKDVDGVTSVTLYYRPPGSTTWSSKPMNPTSAGTWSANLDTGRDKISIPTPPTGTLSWYIKAVDTKNLASQTKTSSITIRLCDTTAPVIGKWIFGPSTVSLTPESPTNGCRPNTVSFSVPAADNESGVANVTLTWTDLTGLQHTQTMKGSAGVWSTSLNAIAQGLSPGVYGPVFARVTNGVGLVSQTSNWRFSVVKC